MIKFCIKCEVETNRYKNGACVQCAKIYRVANKVKAKSACAAWYKANRVKSNTYGAAYRKANPEKIKATNNAWRKANPEKTKAHSTAYNAAHREERKSFAAAYAKAHPDKIKERFAAYYVANKCQLNERTKAWRASNPEKVKDAAAAWRSANPDARRIIEQNRRARKRANGGVLSKDIATKLFKLQKGKCPCCSKPLGDNYHLDHIVPVVLGGANEDWNMQLLTQRCNNQKHAKPPIDFMQSKGFLL